MSQCSFQIRPLPPAQHPARHRYFWLELAVICFLAGTPILQAEPAPSTNAAVRLDITFIERLSESMRTNHPALKAARHRTTAASEDVRAVPQWADPAFKVGGSMSSVRGGNPAEDGNLVYGLEQQLPVFGKERAARRLAEAEASLETERASLQFQLQRRDLSKALFELALQDRLIALGQEDLTWLEAQLKVAEARLLAGTGSQLETLRLQSERAMRTNLLGTEIRRGTEARATVNQLLGRSPESSFPLLTLPDIAQPIVVTPDLIRFATNTEPRLLVASRELRAAEARVESARKARLPDLAVGVEGRQFHGDAGFREGLFTVGFNLPWFNGKRYRAALTREKERQSALQLDRTSLELEVVTEIHQRIARIESARSEAWVLREDILPRTRQSVALTLAGWTSSRMEFREMMEARRLSVEGEAALARAIAMQWIEMSDLVLCCGLSDLEMLQELGAPKNRP